MKCLNCGATEGTLSKEFDPEKSYSWQEIAQMTEVCASWADIQKIVNSVQATPIEKI